MSDTKNISTAFLTEFSNLSESKRQELLNLVLSGSSSGSAPSPALTSTPSATVQNTADEPSRPSSPDVDRPEVDVQRESSDSTTAGPSGGSSGLLVVQCQSDNDDTDVEDDEPLVARRSHKSSTSPVLVSPAICVRSH